MANDETRAAGNFKERFSYPKDATMRVVRQLEGELDEARAELARLRAEVAAAREVEAGAKFAGTSLVDWLQSEADRQDRITDELLTGELPDGQRNCRVPFQQFFAMAYRKIAELIENTTAPDLLGEVRRLRAANAELAGAINAPLWLVWSNEHRAWWGPNGRNYYWGIESAGRYTLAEAQKICGTRGVERGNGINPPELVQPSPELIAMWDAAARAAVVAEKGTQ